MGEESTCQQILRWRPRQDTVHGDRHDHVCKLDRGHPVDEGIGVQIHHCGTCTLAWESDRRPHMFCRCSATPNPACPIHGKDAS